MKRKSDDQLNVGIEMRSEKLIWLMMLFCYAVLIFYLSSQGQESLPLPQLFPNQDKVMHMTEYAGLGWLSLNVIKPLTPAGFIVSMGFSIVFAATDEMHQAFVPGRDADVLDWMADVVGILISSYYYYHYINWKKPKV